MREYFTQNWGYYAVTTVIGALVSYGMGFEDYVRVLSLMLPITWVVCFFILKKSQPDDETREIINSLEVMLGEQTQVLEEQENVLLEYEKIFDSQLVELPCVCGGNTFQGLFSPKTDNVVQCEKCKQYYKVDINYNTVLISEPLNIDQSFDDLVKNT